MKSRSLLCSFVVGTLVAVGPALADVEAFDDNVMCDFTIIGWTRQTLIDRKLAKNNFDDLHMKVKNHCTGKIETLQFDVGGNIVYSPDSGIVRVDGAFKNPGDRDWTTRNLKLKDEAK